MGNQGIRRGRLALTLAALLLFPWTTVQSSEPVVERSALGAAGGPEFSEAGGWVTVSYNLAEEATGLSGSGALELSGGFYGWAGTGIGPSAPTATLTAPSSTGDVFVGVPIVSSVSLTFDKLMLEPTLAAATSVWRLRDRLCQELFEPTPAALGYDAATGVLSVSPLAGAWESNSLYLLEVSSAALDYEGLPLSPPFTMRFQTLADPTVDNVLCDPNDPAKQVAVASGTYQEAFFVTFSGADAEGSSASTAHDAIAEANRKAQGPVVLVLTLNAFNGQNQLIRDPLPKKPVLAGPYADADGNGFVDGLGNLARVKRLSWHMLDETKRLWIRLPSSSVDLAARLVQASVPHFSSFALIAPQDFSVSEAYGFPVPFRPHGPSAGSGAGRTGTEAGGITFVNLPSEGTIEVYDVRGRLAWRGEEKDGDGKFVWDVRNLAGESVASGVYLYIVRSAREHKVGKLAVIR